MILAYKFLTMFDIKSGRRIFNAQKQGETPRFHTKRSRDEFERRRRPAEDIKKIVLKTRVGIRCT